MKARHVLLNAIGLLALACYFGGAIFILDEVLSWCS
jgi:hypothetical protein